MHTFLRYSYHRFLPQWWLHFHQVCAINKWKYNQSHVFYKNERDIFINLRQELFPMEIWPMTLIVLGLHSIMKRRGVYNREGYDFWICSFLIFGEKWQTFLMKINYKFRFFNGKWKLPIAMYRRWAKNWQSGPVIESGSFDNIGADVCCHTLFVLFHSQYFGRVILGKSHLFTFGPHINSCSCLLLSCLHSLVLNGVFSLEVWGFLLFYDNK